VIFTGSLPIIKLLKVWIDVPKEARVKREKFFLQHSLMYTLLGIGVLSTNPLPPCSSLGAIKKQPPLCYALLFRLTTHSSRTPSWILFMGPSSFLPLIDRRRRPIARIAWPSLWSSTAFLNCAYGSVRSGLGSSIKLWEISDRGQLIRLYVYRERTLHHTKVCVAQRCVNLCMSTCVDACMS
jgi:hypothetical protein